MFTPRHGATDLSDRHDIALVHHQIVDFDVVLCRVLCHTLLGFPFLYDHPPGQRLPSVHRNGGTITRRYYPGRFFQLN